MAGAFPDKQPIAKNDRLLNRPSSYSEYFYWLVLEQWIQPRPVLKLVDKDIGYVQNYILLETLEVLEELDKRNIDLEAYAKETVDILVLLFSLAINNKVKPDFKRVEYTVNGQAPNQTIFLAKMEQLSRPEAVGDLESIQALKGTVEQIMTVVGSFVNHGPEFPFEDYIMQIMKKVIAKNSRNYPALYFQDVHWKSGRNLNAEEIVASYKHACSCLRLLRDVSGKNPAGLDPQVHMPFRYLILDFENADRAFQQLQSELAKGITPPVVLPNYWNDVYAGLENVSEK